MKNLNRRVGMSKNKKARSESPNFINDWIKKKPKAETHRLPLPNLSENSPLATFESSPTEEREGVG